MRALITGATGYIGRSLAHRLSKSGWDVHALLRAASDPADLEASVPNLGSHRLPDPATGDAATLIETVQPDCIFHLAARIQASHTASDVQPLLGANIALGVDLLEGLARLNANRQDAPAVLVAAGTYWAYGTQGEETPNSLYAASKKAFESFFPFYSKHCGVPCCSLLLYDVYGPRDPRGKLIPALIENALDPQADTIGLSPGEQLLDLVYLDDVVQGFVMAAEGLRSGSMDSGRYRLDSGERVTIKGLVTEIAAVTGCAPEVEFGARPYPPHQIMVPLETGPRLPGWAPAVSLKQGLQALWADEQKES